jgi:hypothetical protein
VNADISLRTAWDLSVPPAEQETFASTGMLQCLRAYSYVCLSHRRLLFEPAGSDDLVSEDLVLFSGGQLLVSSNSAFLNSDVHASAARFAEVY